MSEVIIHNVIVENLTWDEWNKGHIAHHNVSTNEVEEVCLGQKIALRTYKNRIAIIGPTQKGKLLYIVLIMREKNSYYPITARVADRKERYLYKNEKGDVIYER